MSCYMYPSANYYILSQNFEVAEEEKRTQQIKAFVARAAPSTSAAIGWLERLNPYQYLKADPKSVAVETLPSNLVLPLQKAIVQDGKGGRMNRHNMV